MTDDDAVFLSKVIRILKALEQCSKSVSKITYGYCKVLESLS